MKWTTRSSALEHIHSLLFCIECNIVDATAAQSTFILCRASAVIVFAVLCFLPRKHFCIPAQSILMSLSDRISNAQFYRGSVGVPQPGAASPSRAHPAALLCRRLPISSRLNLIREMGARCTVLLTDCCFGNTSITCFLL